MATFGSIAANAAFSQMSGTATNDDAVAGNIGEMLENGVILSGALSMTTATSKTITSIVLTAGDWDVNGNVNLSYTSATQSGDAQACISSVTNSLTPIGGTDDRIVLNNTRHTTTTSKVSISVPKIRVITLGATFYLVAQATFSAGTCAGYGHMQARRVR